MDSPSKEDIIYCSGAGFSVSPLAHDFGPNADSKEVALFGCALMAWAEAIERRFPEPSMAGRLLIYDVDLRLCPVVEINDGVSVRRFTVTAGHRGLSFALSDPIREVNRAHDPTLNDHVVLLERVGYCDGQTVTGLAHRVLNRLSFLVPRKHREAIVGDVFEDLYQMRADGRSEGFMVFVVVWQVLLALGRGFGPLLQRVLFVDRIQKVVRDWLRT